MNAVPARSSKVGEDVQTPSEFEGEIREFFRRDVAQLRRPAPDGPSEQAASNINSLLDRVSGSSGSEVDNLISALRNGRALLQTEGEPVQSGIASLAHLSHVALTSVQ